jgi:hypothetical protein
MNMFQPAFDRQKDYFNSDATKSYDWRIEQLDRMAKMLNENNDAFQEAVSKDFKTALEEKVFEVAAPLATIEFTKTQLKQWMKPISALVPKALAASGHTAHIIREPYSSHTGHSAHPETTAKAGQADEPSGSKVGAAAAGSDQLGTRRCNLRDRHNDQKGRIERSLSFGRSRFAVVVCAAGSPSRRTEHRTRFGYRSIG